jgi:hypothetical protein
MGVFIMIAEPLVLPVRFAKISYGAFFNGFFGAGLLVPSAGFENRDFLLFLPALVQSSP